MHLYRKTIVLFGIIVPIIVAAAIIGFASMLKSKMIASFETKEKTHKAFKQSQIQANHIESDIGRQRDHLQRWNDQLSQETASAVATTLRGIIDKLPSKEIQQTAFEPRKTSSGFGSVTSQNSSQLRMAFRSTFRTQQRMFLELETRMPQLQLQELRIDPSSTQSSLANFQVTYTAWEN